MLELDIPPIEIGDFEQINAGERAYRTLSLHLKTMGMGEGDPSPQMILKLSAEAVLSYVIRNSPDGAKLYWRTKPEISQCVEDSGHAIVHTFCCRFLISESQNV